MKLLNHALVHQLADKANQSARGRSMYNLHEQPHDTLQRMLNYLTRHTYVQPHKHEKPAKREAFVVLKGELAYLEFDNQGCISRHAVLNPEQGNYGVEITPRAWHTLIPISDEVLVFEVKDGPYQPETDKVFAPWAPAEGDPNCAAYQQQCLQQIL